MYSTKMHRGILAHVKWGTIAKSVGRSPSAHRAAHVQTDDTAYWDGGTYSESYCVTCYVFWHEVYGLLAELWSVSGP